MRWPLLPVLIWSAVAVAVGHCLEVYYWSSGSLRGGALIACMLIAVVLQRARRGADAVAFSPLLGRAVVLGAVLLLAYHAYVGVSWIRKTELGGEIRLDQGQSVYRSLKFFPELNPYAREALLDPIYYIMLIERHHASGCLRFPIPAPGPDASVLDQELWRNAMLQRVTRFWSGYDLRIAAELMPAIEPSRECAAAALGFGSLGFKYGPLTLFAYAPAIAALDKPGVFLTQLALFAAICALVWLIARESARNQARESARDQPQPPPHAAHVAWITLLVLLAIPSLRTNLLSTSALDGTATVLCLAALLLWLKRQPHAMCAVLGCAFAAKLLPSLLYAPLLLTAPRRHWPTFFACALLPYVPFALWDAQGLINNVLLFPLTRGGDSSSLVFALPTAVQPFVTAAFGALWLGTLYRTARGGFDPASTTRYLLIAHLSVLAGSSALHNNYMIWLAPVLALFTVELLRAGPRQDGRILRHSSERSGVHR